MPGRQPRFFPLESPDMERAEANKGEATNPFKYKGPSVKVGGVRVRANPMKVVYKKKRTEDSDGGCKMCSEIFWAPMSILCGIPPCSILRECCIA